MRTGPSPATASHRQGSRRPGERGFSEGMGPLQVPGVGTVRGLRNCLDPGTKVRSLNSLNIMGEYWEGWAWDSHPYHPGRPTPVWALLMN